MGEQGITSENYLNTKMLSRLTQVPEQTLANWRHRGLGPPYIKAGKHVRYQWGEVQRWLTARKIVPDGGGEG